MAASVFWIFSAVIVLLPNIAVCHDPTIYMKTTFPHTQKIDNYNTIVVEKDKDCYMACVIDKKPRGVALQWVVQIHHSNISIPISTDTDTQNAFKYQLDKPATNIFRLKIQNTQVSDEGLYICRVQLHSQQFANVSRMVKVIHKPQIIDIFTSSNMIKEEGDKVELKCAADGIPKPIITWSRAGGGILPSGGRELVSPTLTIEKADRSHMGTYKCTTMNIAGKDVRRIKLDVKYMPLLSAKAKEVFQAPGYDRELKCEVKGNPAPKESELVWLKDGGILEQGDKYEMESFSGSSYVLMKLRIHHINEDDYGRYSCYAENSQGNGQDSVVLSKTDVYVSDMRTRQNDASEIKVDIIFTLLLVLIWVF